MSLTGSCRPVTWMLAALADAARGSASSAESATSTKVRGIIARHYRPPSMSAALPLYAAHFDPYLRLAGLEERLRIGGGTALDRAVVEVERRSVQRADDRVALEV